jgi:two-component system CheB/CheR fusion protein
MASETSGPKSPSPPKQNGARPPGPTAPVAPLLIVGIGASAGGLEAFKSFFSAMAPDPGLAFVLVQHLSPDHKSMLAELLARVTDMKVIEAEDGFRVAANTVYVIPPDSTLTIERGCLRVARPAPPRDRRRPIDTFFRSLAEDQGENAIAIILSGTGSDGSLGLTAIKEHGGFTLAQAEFDSHAMAGMPQSATSTGQVDEVLAVEAMPARLGAYQQHLTRLVARKISPEPAHGAPQFSTIMGALRARSGHDFSEYKEKTLGRRLRRRMQVLHLESRDAYIDYFREHPEELDRLFHELLIGVTEFFRDPDAFESLADKVLKDLVGGRGADEDIRVWVPACSTGQEAYTVAILLREAMNGRRIRPKVQIFATDIDERAITIARIGRYRQPIAGLSQARAERWFTQEGAQACVVSEIRDMCIFSAHSVIKNPPFSKLDLISCRNLLIYLDPNMQDRVMRTFHYALKPGGHLFLGSSESVTRATDLFSVVNKKHRLFARREVGRASLPDLAASGRGLETLQNPETPPRRAEDRIDKSTRRVTEKYNPPHVVIDSRDRILRFSGPAMGQYVELSPGAPSYALFDILRKALRPAVRAVLKDARGTRGAVHHANVPARLGGQTRFVTLIAEPLEDQGAETGLFVLIFQDVGAGVPGGRAPQMDKESNDSFKALEQELRTTRAQLQSTIDELETANEELKSSNEEYQSVNEELQSSNEEMETSKEEMQSINEEIQTINSEMIGKNEQLTHLNSDLKNLLESTEIATLFLDGQLRVRSFTPSVTEIFHVRDNDIGRPISEVVSVLDYADLQIDVRTVLRKLTLVERQVALHNTKTTFTLRIRPFRTIDNVIDGVVMTFVDMTERQAAQETLRASEARFRMLFEHIDEGFCILEKVETPSGAPIDFCYLAANAGFAKQSGVANVIGKTIREVFPGESEDWFRIYDAVMVTGESNRFERDLATQGRTLEVFAFRFEDEGVNRLGVLFLDVSQRKNHEDQQALLLREMDHRVKNLFAIVSGVVALSARSATTAQGLARTVQGRLSALASAHQLIRPGLLNAQDVKRETTLAELIRKVLSPYADEAASDDTLHAHISGPEVSVGAEAATSVALIVHELATNAAKYGALSVPGGRVGISWSVDEGRLALIWTEVGGPAVKGPPVTEGFGSLLARKSISGQLAGDLTFHWNPQGLEVRLSANLERLAL